MQTVSQSVSQSVSQYICHSDLNGTGRNAQKTKVSLFMYLFSEHDLFFMLAERSTLPGQTALDPERP